MTLQKKSLAELRAIAQSVGITPRWDVGKEQLLQDISQHVSVKIAQPEKPIQVNITMPNDQGGMLTPHIVEGLVKGFADLGLSVTFPDERTWEMSCNGKKDSGTMAMSSWSVIQCAKEIIRP